MNKANKYFTKKILRIIGLSIIFSALLITFARVALPIYSKDNYALKNLILSKISFPVQIQSLDIKLIGGNLVFRLKDVDIDQPKKASMHAKELLLVVDIIKSILYQEVTFQKVIIEHAKIQFYDNSMRPHFPIHWIAKVKSPLESAFSLTFFKNIIIKDTDINFGINDEDLAFQNVILHFYNDNEKAKLRAKAELKGHSRSSVQFGGDFKDYQDSVQNIDGHFYFEFSGTKLGKFLKKINMDLAVDFEEESVLKTWVMVENKTVVDAIVELNAHGINFTTEDQELLNIPSIQGYLGYENKGGIQTLKAIDLKAVSKNSTFEGMNFSVSRTATLPHSWINATGWNLNLNILLPIIKNMEGFNVQPLSLSEFELGGIAKYIHWRSMADGEHYILLKADALSIANDFAKISGINGDLYWDKNVGFSKIESEKLEIIQNDFYYNSLIFANFQADVILDLNHDFKVQARNISANYKGESLHTNFDLLINDNKPKHLDLVMASNKLDPDVFMSLLPSKIISKKLLAWLDKSISGGQLVNAELIYQGEPKNFPFKSKRSNFLFNSDIEDIEINYSQYWPKVEHLNATLSFDNRKFNLISKQAKLKGTPLLSAEILIPDVLKEEKEIIFNGSMNGTLGLGKEILQKSNLSSVVKSLRPLTVDGPVNLALGLNIPLHATPSKPIAVRGLVNILDGKLKVPEWNLAVNQLKGEVQFTENSLNSSGLKGNIFGNEALFEIFKNSSKSDPALHVKTTTSTPIVDLLNWLNFPHQAIFLGQADYEAELVISDELNQSVQLNIHSDLKTLAIDAPNPIRKSIGEQLPLQLSLNFEPNGQLRVLGSAGADKSVALRLTKINNDWKIISGNMSFSENTLANFSVDNNFLINGKVSNLNVHEWFSFIKIFDNSKDNTLKPTINLMVEQLGVGGVEFNEVSVQAEYNYLKAQWLLSVSGKDLKGSLLIPENPQEMIVANFEKLFLPAINKNNHNQELWKRLEAKPPILISARKLKMDTLLVQNVNIKLEPSDVGYLIKEMQGIIDSAEFQATGIWNEQATGPAISLSGLFKTKNITRSMNALGKRTSLERANGEVQFNVSWSGDIFQVLPEKLQGNARVQFKQGQLKGVNPGMGRILSLLNFDTLQRRLQFDFSDVTKEGFAFDSLNAELELDKGKVSTKQLSIQGPIASIKLSGEADLNTRKIAADMDVKPNTAASLPLAAAVASGNPAIGAAVWIIDKIVGSHINEITKLHYRVSGIIEEPVVKELRENSRGSRHQRGIDG